MTTRRSFIIQATAATISATTDASVRSGEGEHPTRTWEAKRPPPSSTRQRSSDVVKLAIVGTGQISHRYLKQAQQSTRARFVATCARTIDSAKSRAVEYGVPSWFDNYETMLEKTRPDGVIIATPTVLHASQAIAALDRGIHVLCEKPMASSFDECRAVVTAAAKSGRTFLAMPFDATPQTKAAIAHLNEASLGVFTGAEAQLLLPGVSRDNWYYDKKTAGGGAGLDTLVYPVSRLITLLGPARRVTGFVNTLIPHRLLGDGATIDFFPPPRNSTKSIESSVDDNATLLIEWMSGQQAVVRALWGTSFLKNDTTIYCRRGTLWISGADVVIHSREKQIAGALPIEWAGQKSCYKIPYDTSAKTEGLVDHFVDCIRRTAIPTCGGEQQLHVHEILFRGYDASQNGRSQNLETTFTPWQGSDPTFYDTRSRLI